MAFYRPLIRTEDDMTISKSILGAAVVSGLLAFGAGAALADGPQAIATAANHAGLAAGAGDIDMVHRHLHHVLNCLVGAGGNGFDAAPGNPCMGSGSAIPQTTDAAMKAKLEAAAQQARGGIANNDMAAAKKVATDIQTALK
jgi:hypothetical protein